MYLVRRDIRTSGLLESCLFQNNMYDYCERDASFCKLLLLS